MKWKYIFCLSIQNEFNVNKIEVAFIWRITPRKTETKFEPMKLSPVTLQYTYFNFFLHTLSALHEG